MPSDGLILSQSEIDALLSSLGSEQAEPAPGVDSSKAKNYDFRHPDKFSKEQIRALQTIMQNFARLAVTGWSSYMRGRVQIQVASVEQIPYDEYVAQLPDPAAIGILSLDPLPGRMILELGMPIFSVFFDRLLGGTGSDVRLVTEIRDTERVILVSLMNRVLAPFREAWSGVSDVDPRLEEIVLSPQQLHSAMPGGVAVLAVFEILYAEQTGTMTVCIPDAVLIPVMNRLTPQTWLSGGGGGGEDMALHVAQQLGGVVVPVTVKLSGATLTLRDLMHLEPSDVICLDGAVDEDLEVAVGEHVKYLAAPGVCGNRMAVRVTRVLREEAEYAEKARR